MYHGKFVKQRRALKNKILLLASLVILLTASVFGTMAFLHDSTQGLENVFTTSGVPNKVIETLDGNIKKDVKIQNSGNTDAYVRAKVLITWGTAKNDDIGTVWGTKPIEDVDYTILFPADSSWEKGTDGYYYYTAGAVAPNAETGVLFTDCTVNDNAAIPAGYYLSVEIMGQSIQAKGTDGNGQAPVELAWGVTVKPDGTLSVP